MTHKSIITMTSLDDMWEKIESPDQFKHLGNRLVDSTRNLFYN